MLFRVVETSVFDIEADNVDEAEALVRDGTSHSDELVEASRQFFVSERTVEQIHASGPVTR